MNKFFTEEEKAKLDRIVGRIGDDIEAAVQTVEGAAARAGLALSEQQFAGVKMLRRISDGAKAALASGGGGVSPEVVFAFGNMLAGGLGGTLPAVEAAPEGNTHAAQP